MQSECKTHVYILYLASEWYTVEHLNNEGQPIFFTIHRFLFTMVHRNKFIVRGFPQLGEFIISEVPLYTGIFS